MMFKPGQQLVPWVDPRLEARSSHIAGSGLFACQPIHKGEIVLRWGGIVFTRAEILAGRADPQTIAILDEDLYLADPKGSPPAEDYIINHSCNSNLWMEDAITLSARKDILPGEEATADYALWLYDVDWVLDPCRCGSPLCRE
jgi:SET domain-containing protein